MRVSVRVQAGKLYNNKYMIEKKFIITNTEIFAFVALLAFIEPNRKTIETVKK